MIKDALRFIIPILALAVASWAAGFSLLALLLLALGCFVCYFFRNPRRRIPQGRNLVVSPADGRIVRIAPAPMSPAATGGRLVSIFLGLFDVHVNRAPVDGILEEIEYRRGRFKAAFRHEASDVNEQNVLTIRSGEMRVIVKQIAGVVARRVVCWKQAGQHMRRGELIGLIRFGSRVDIELPPNVKLLVSEGDRVRGGTTVLGEYV